MRKLFARIAFVGVIFASPAAAEVELNFYLGYQESPHSTVSGDTGGPGGAFSKYIAWEGKSFQAPPYYGLRATWWRPSDWGFGLELTHTKVYAPAADMAPEFSRLEFTDGHNIITLNVARRWKDQWMNGRLTPFVTAGVGVAVPHVDIQPTYAGAPKTYGYQVTGPAVRLGAGVSYSINDRWSVFGEYQFTWSDNKADINGGGTIETTLITNALNFGVGYSF